MDENKYFDADGFQVDCRQAERYGVEVAEAVRTLKNEGLDVSVKELSTYPDRFPDIDADETKNRYKSHFVALYKQAESRLGWLPAAERQRMFDNFLAVYKRTRQAVSKIISALNFGCVLEDAGQGAQVNVEATEEANRQKYVIDVDGKAMAQHWAMLSELREKMDALKEWERKHRLPVFGLPSPSDFGLFSYFVNAVETPSGAMIELTEQDHNKSVWTFFAKDRNKK